MANIASTLRYMTGPVRSLFASGRPSLFSGRGGGGGYVPVRATQVPSARFDWTTEAGDYRQNPIVALGVDWINRNLCSVPLELYYRTRFGHEVKVDNHPILDLLQNPNPSYSGHALLQAAVIDILCEGHGFWAIVPNYGGTVGELYWLDGRYMAPNFPNDGSVYLNTWKYIPASTGKPEEFEPANIIDFKRGIDPWNDRLGYSPLHACKREIALINMMASYTGSILKNIGVTNIVVSPAGDVPFSAEQSERIKYEVIQAIGLDNKGTPLVLRQPVQTESLGTKPSEMMMPEIDSGAVARILSAIGLSPMVVGLPDETRTYSNYREAQRAAWMNSIIPMHTLIVQTLAKKLLPIYDPTGRFHLKWNYEDVEALSEDKGVMAVRAKDLFDSGIATLNEARDMVGLEAREDGDRFKTDTPQAMPPGVELPRVTSTDENDEQEENTQAA